MRLFLLKRKNNNTMDIYCPHCENEFESNEWEGECPYCGASWWKEETYLGDYLYLPDSWYDIYFTKRSI
jgi:hypothetical protein